ncbi:MAG: hypothetical protein IJN63_06860 [Clostridia bacterium]|nr:hypothetical protein [Clostridia bacterium]
MLYTKQTGSNASTKKTNISSDGQIVFEQTGTDNVGAVVYSYGLTRISAKSRTALTAQQGTTHRTVPRVPMIVQSGGTLAPVALPFAAQAFGGS